MPEEPQIRRADARRYGDRGGGGLRGEFEVVFGLEFAFLVELEFLLDAEVFDDVALALGGVFAHVEGEHLFDGFVLGGDGLALWANGNSLE